MDFEEWLHMQDEPGILRSRDYFNTLIKEEMDKGIPPSRIVVGGFSQGGAMSLFTGLTSTERLGGIFGLSCYLPLSDRIKNFMPEELPNKKTPVFLAHGKIDDIVPYELGTKSVDMLKSLGMEDVKFFSYEWVSFVFRLLFCDCACVLDADASLSGTSVTPPTFWRLRIWRPSWRRSCLLLGRPGAPPLVFDGRLTGNWDDVYDMYLQQHTLEALLLFHSTIRISYFQDAPKCRTPVVGCHSRSSVGAQVTGRQQ